MDGAFEAAALTGARDAENGDVKGAECGGSSHEGNVSAKASGPECARGRNAPAGEAQLISGQACSIKPKGAGQKRGRGAGDSRAGVRAKAEELAGTAGEDGTRACTKAEELPGTAREDGIRTSTEAEGLPGASGKARPHVRTKAEELAGTAGEDGTRACTKAEELPGRTGEVRTRTSARAEELPKEAREAIDRMLSDGGCTYQHVVDELAKAGFAITKGAVGRREAGRTADERMERLFKKQMDALGKLIEKQSGFDAADAALKLVIGKLGRRIGSEAGLFDNMPAEKAVAGLIQAARTAIQYEKMAGDRKRLRVQAREEAVRELREALIREPELWERIEKLAAGAE